MIAVGGMKIFLTLLLLFSSSNSSDILVKELKSIEIYPADVDWPLLYAEFRALSRLGPKHLEALLQRPLFKLRMELFQEQIVKFFSLKTVEAFTALENESGNSGLVLFFIRALICSTALDLYFNPNFFFSFDEIIYDYPENKFIEKTVELLVKVFKSLQNQRGFGNCGKNFCKVEN
jgi:5-methylcytosine-specific restriction endonuclease McrBC regulatory subunit McrC